MSLKLIFLLSLVLRIAFYASWRTEDYTSFETGDYILYDVGARHILEEGDLSNSLFLPRPFLFPLFVAALGVNKELVLLANVVLGTLLTPLTYLLARRLQLPHRVAIGAALVVAVDPGSITHSVFLGPEALANFLLVLSLVALLKALDAATTHNTFVGIAAGALLAASALTRPAAYLLWVFLGLWGWFSHPRQRRAVVAYVLACIIPVGGWVLHNSIVFHNPTFSTVAGFTMLYYRAAAVEHLATGEDIDTVFLDLTRRVEARVGNDPALADGATRWGYHAASPELTGAIYQVSAEVFATYPLTYVATFAVGFVRMFGLLPAQSPFDGLLALMDAVWNNVFVATSILGVWLGVRQKRWTLVWVTLLVSLYFIGGILLVKSAGMDTRERSMLTPLMACVSAYLVTAFFDYRARRRRVAA